MYENFKEIEKDLKRLNLERKIALEEIKGIKYKLEEDISPYHWISSLLSIFKKYGVLYLGKKLFKKIS